MGVLEAMASNTPVVATWAGGIPDAITHNVDGLLVDAGDVEQLANALISILLNDELRSRLVNNASDKFAKNFSIDTVIPKLELIYQYLQTRD